MYRALFAAFLAISLAIPAHAAGRLFVVSKSKKTLQVFNADSGKMEFEVPGPGEPHEVVVSSDGRFAYLGDAKGFKNTLCVVDLDKRAVVEELDMKPHMRPHGMALTHDGKKLYVTSAPTRAVVEFDTAPLRMGRAFKFFVDSVDNLRMSPDESLIFASSTIDGNIVVLDVKKGEYERAIISGDSPEGLAISPDGAELWVANRVSQTVAVIDIAKRKRTHSLPCIGNPMNVYFTPDGGQVIVTLAVADRLAVFDRAKRAELTRFEVGDFPVELAFGEDGGPAFVTCAVANDVAVVDIKAQKVLRRIPVGGDPEGIAYWNK